MTLLTYVRDVNSDVAFFAVVADDAGASYVWPKDKEPWFDGEKRNEYLAIALGATPEDEQGWINLATANLGQGIEADPPFDDFASNDEATKAATEYLETQVTPERPNPAVHEGGIAFDQIAADYPGFGESPEGLTAEAMDNYVMLMLGDIDPEGPNGWILRAQDGEPRPGDENEYLHLPGTSTIEPQEDSE